MRKAVDQTSDEDDGNDVDFIKVLLEIQQKIDGSPVLNGGYTTLIRKVEKIDEAQGRLEASVDAIHTAIYDPDKGLFSRLNTCREVHTHETSELDKKLVALSTWQTYTSKAVDETVNDENELASKFNVQDQRITTLTERSQTTREITKWVSSAIAGGVIVLLFKILYTWIVAHWK